MQLTRAVLNFVKKNFHYTLKSAKFTKVFVVKVFSYVYGILREEPFLNFRVKSQLFLTRS